MCGSLAGALRSRRFASFLARGRTSRQNDCARRAGRLPPQQNAKHLGPCGIRTHARERIGALIQRLRPTRPKDLEILVKVCGDNMKPTKMAGSAPWPRATPRGRRAGAMGARRCSASASPSSASQKERVRPADEGSTGFSDTGSSIEQHRIDGRSRLRSRFVTRWPKNSPPRHFYPPPVMPAPGLVRARASSPRAQ